jgi:maleylpyruvate isomerase
MKLYGYWRSSATWRARIVLHHKGMEFTYVPVHLVRDGGEQKSPAHLARNPMAQVPVLEHDGVFLGQSLAIAEYLEELQPEPTIFPGGLLARARARQCAEIVNAGIQPLQNLSVLVRLTEQGQDKLAWARHFIGRGFDALEATAAPVAGTCLVGDEVSVADACLVPQVYNARRFQLDMERWPTLARVDAHLSALPAFVAAHADNQIDAG